MAEQGAAHTGNMAFIITRVRFGSKGTILSCPSFISVQAIPPNLEVGGKSDCNAQKT
jgi:hypothetical protein